MRLIIDIDTSSTQATKLLAFLKTLDFVKVEEKESVVPEFHKKIVRHRLKTAKSGDYLPWEDVQKELDAFLG